MGVYIKCMEMPKQCNRCAYYRVSLTKNGFCTEIRERIEWGQQKITRHPNCPLIEVPEPHGRLIDADAFAEEMKERQEAAYEWMKEAKDHDTTVRADGIISFLCEIKLTLDKMLTVIPASKEEE